MDLIKLSKTTEKIVCKNNKRKYYRFRAARYYGGIATADCVGCNLRCLYCWSWNVVNNPTIGIFYSPAQVANKLINIAKSKGFSQLRISGNEPTLCKQHLLKVLELTSSYRFILETNGILLADENYAKQLAKFKNLHVRVSLKGTNREEFSLFSQSKPTGFDLQLKALENLYKVGVSCHAALIEIAKQNLKGLEKKLSKISLELADIEIEPLILYPAVKARLEKAKII